MPRLQNKRGVLVAQPIHTVVKLLNSASIERLASRSLVIRGEMKHRNIEHTSSHTVLTSTDDDDVSLW
jgi:hypothetical protein